MNKIIKLILDFIFPIECLDCGREGEFLCAECLSKIKRREIKQCPLCNQPQATEELCAVCCRQTALERIIISADYENEILQKTIHYFKYKYIRDLGAALGRVMLNKLTPPPDFSGFLVIPTPLHRRRALERGFNQAEILAQIIAKQFNLPLNSKVLRRRKNIKHQASLDRAGRLKNIQGCFQIKNPELIRGRKILLIDDVITTGATLNEQAELLKQNGAEKIWALVVAKN